MTWMPATIPIWVISCWAALITPSSSAATSLEADATVDGVASPLPTPGQGQGHQDDRQGRAGPELGEDHHGHREDEGPGHHQRAAPPP